MRSRPQYVPYISEDPTRTAPGLVEGVIEQDLALFGCDVRQEPDRKLLRYVHDLEANPNGRIAFGVMVEAQFNALVAPQCRSDIHDVEGRPLQEPSRLEASWRVGIERV